MNKRTRPFLLAIATTAMSLQMTYAQRGFFKDLSHGEKAEKMKTVPVENIKKYSILEMNDTALKTYLSSAPSASQYKKSGISLEIPLPNGKTETFVIYESSVLAPELQALHPDIRTYKGEGTQNPGYKIRFSLTSEGFNAIILGVGGDTVIIEKIRNVNNLYKSYFSKDTLLPAQPVSQNRCGTSLDLGAFTQKLQNNASLANGKLSNGDHIKKFKLAIAATGEYTAAFGGGNANAAYATIVAYVNEVNAVYEAELGVNLQLVSGTNVVYTDPASDPYTANDQGTMLDENRANLANVIGNANYDVGHVFGAGGSGSGGGVAFSPAVCNDTYKGGGVSDIGDEVNYARVFSIQLIAHEIGHQFGMSHSYNSNIPVCTTRRYTTSVEPGSGATVMSYGFTCANNNPANGVTGDDDYSDSYDGTGKKIGPFLNFHTASIKQALDYISTLSCYTTVASGNTIPVINAMQASYTVPKSTPFYLKGTATDGDNDPLSYSWEGTNISDLQDVTGSNGSPAAPPGLDGTVLENTTHPPFFRSYPPVTAGTDPGLRYYPLLAAVLGGTNYSKGDKLPSVAIETTHTLTVRDGRGGTVTKNVVVNVDNSGPFLITNDPSGTYTPGYNLPVHWSVNGTNNAPVNCKLVDIWLSTDGGYTFTLLASALPNSGTANVILPNVTTSHARLKITPGTSTVSGNVPGIFFDISNTDFSIGSTLAANNPAVKNDEIRIYSDARNIVVASSVQKILSVELFDMSGRHLYKKKNINANIFSIPDIGLNRQVVIVEVITQQGKVETKKLLIN
ncbi:reprolysin-like metallopeptidase [Chryseobacterium arthrosphaerae]|uniref:reprolysin-like metallopeptidase n=1 Tax=Chryseobacterium arthrosphaerae TaxID=651561 RepID=UPI0031DC8A66